MPVSFEIGRAPSRHSFMPLYSPGLWLAVTHSPPSQASEPIAKYAMGVSESPRRMTFAPASRMPWLTASASSGECTRMSWPTTRVLAFRKRANALPIRFASAASSSVGTMPRMS